jgi:hypothetical protein
MVVEEAAERSEEFALVGEVSLRKLVAWHDRRSLIGQLHDPVDISWDD